MVCWCCVQVGECEMVQAFDVAVLGAQVRQLQSVALNNAVATHGSCSMVSLHTHCFVTHDLASQPAHRVVTSA
jgi:hypothetical protein